MKSILVTGATGFLGNYVVNELIERGFNVITTSSNLTTAESATWFSKVTHLPLDFQRIDRSLNYFDYFRRPDIVIDLAWEGLPNYTSLHHFENNVFNHYWLLKNFINQGLKDVTITGTCFEYGMQQGCLNEDMCTIPANPYALGKDTLRKFMEQLQEKFFFHLKWVRLFYMYGKGQNSKSLLSQLDKALEEEQEVFNMSGGEQERDYLPVEAVARYIVTIALQQNVEGIINCCSGHPITIKNLVEDYLREKKKNIKLNFGYYPYSNLEPMNFWGCNKKLKSILNE